MCQVLFHSDMSLTANFVEVQQQDVHFFSRRPNKDTGGVKNIEHPNREIWWTWTNLAVREPIHKKGQISV